MGTNAHYASDATIIRDAAESVLRDHPVDEVRSPLMATSASKIVNPDALPTVTGKKRTVKVRATLDEFGRQWRLIRPNQLVANQMIGSGDDMNMAAIGDYFKAHLHPDDREEFMAAALADDTLEIEDFMDLMSRMSEAVFEDVKEPKPDE